MKQLHLISSYKSKPTNYTKYYPNFTTSGDVIGCNVVEQKMILRTSIGYDFTISFSPEDKLGSFSKLGSNFNNFIGAKFHYKRENNSDYFLKQLDIRYSENPKQSINFLEVKIGDMKTLNFIGFNYDYKCDLLSNAKYKHIKIHFCNQISYNKDLVLFPYVISTAHIDCSKKHLAILPKDLGPKMFTLICNDKSKTAPQRVCITTKNEATSTELVTKGKSCMTIKVPLGNFKPNKSELQLKIGTDLVLSGQPHKNDMENKATQIIATLHNGLEINYKSSDHDKMNGSVIKTDYSLLIERLKQIYKYYIKIIKRHSPELDQDKFTVSQGTIQEDKECGPGQLKGSSYTSNTYYYSEKQKVDTVNNLKLIHNLSKTSKRKLDVLENQKNKISIEDFTTEFLDALKKVGDMKMNLKDKIIKFNASDNVDDLCDFYEGIENDLTIFTECITDFSLKLSGENSMHNA